MTRRRKRRERVRNNKIFRKIHWHLHEAPNKPTAEEISEVKALQKKMKDV